MTRMTRVAMSVVACALGAASAAAAQETTVEELVTAALDRAPDIRAARAAIDSARGQLDQAALRPNPAMVATQQQLSGGTHETTVGVEWPLDLFRRTGRVAVAQRGVEATTLSVRDQERQLAHAVREQAGRYLAARRNLEVANEALILSRRMRDLLTQRVNEGEAPRLDANVATVQTWRTEADQAIAEGEAAVAAIQLKALVGLPPDAPLTIRDSLESLVRAPVASQVAQPASGFEGRPDVREAAVRVALADARLDAARQEGRFDLMLSASYDRMAFGFPQLGLTPRASAPVPIEGLFQGVTVSGTLTLPWKNRNQGSIASAQADRSGAADALAARERSARAELDAALARDDAARRAVGLYASSVRELARQNADVMLESYDLGRAAMGDLLAEQRRYLEIEEAYTGLLSRAYEARISVRRALGEVR